MKHFFIFANSEYQFKRNVILLSMGLQNSSKKPRSKEKHFIRCDKAILISLMMLLWWCDGINKKVHNIIIEAENNEWDEIAATFNNTAGIFLNSKQTISTKLIPRNLLWITNN